MKKFITICVLIMAVIFVALLVVLNWNYDIEPQDFSDLALPPRQQIADENNAYFYFSQAEENFNLTEDDKNFIRQMARKDADLSPENQNKLSALIAKNSVFFDLIDQGINAPYCQFPEVKSITYEDKVLSEINQLRLSFLLKLRLAEQTENWDEYFKISKNGIILGKMLMQNSHSLIMYLIGSSTEKTIIDQQIKTVQDCDDIAILENFSILLNDIKNDDFSFQKAMKAEFHSFNLGLKYFTEENNGSFSALKLIFDEEDNKNNSIILSILDKIFPLNYVFQPEKTKAKVAPLFRQVIAEDDNFYNQTKAEKFSDRIYEERENKIKLLLKPNFAGNMLLTIMAPNYGVIRHKSKLTTSLSALKLLIALKKYHLQNGDFPERLADLVPDFLVELPQDDFGGEDFVYDKERGIFYSVGENGEDDGGIFSRDKKSTKIKTNWRTKDVVFGLE